MTYQCPKCLGKGQIPAYRNVMGGVCFKCSGAGSVLTKPCKPSTKWAFCANGEAVVYKRAKNESDALKMAKAFFADAPKIGEVTVSVHAVDW